MLLYCNCVSKIARGTLRSRPRPPPHRQAVCIRSFIPERPRFPVQPAATCPTARVECEPASMRKAGNRSWRGPLRHFRRSGNQQIGPPLSIIQLATQMWCSSMHLNGCASGMALSRPLCSRHCTRALRIHAWLHRCSASSTENCKRGERCVREDDGCRCGRGLGTHVHAGATCSKTWYARMLHGVLLQEEWRTPYDDIDVRARNAGMSIEQRNKQCPCSVWQWHYSAGATGQGRA
jgi:hypothetical protein